MKRRDFLKVLGIGGAGVTAVSVNALALVTTPEPEPEKLPENEALEELVRRLENGEGYYVWTAIHPDFRNWLVRFPRKERMDSDWMRYEQIELIHVCNPEEFMDAFNKRALARLSDHCGYGRKGECCTCRCAIPPLVVSRYGAMCTPPELRPPNSLWDKG